MSGGGVERHLPQHPLPDEIQKMKRDETVCKYCGVSYLIHNEIKALEDKLKSVLQELQHYKGLEDREKALQEQISEKMQRILEIESTVVQRDALIAELQTQVVDAASSLTEETKMRKNLENKLEETGARLTKLQSSLSSSLPAVRAALSKQWQEVQVLKKDAEYHKEVFRQGCSQYQDQFVSLVGSFKSEHLAVHQALMNTKEVLEDHKKRESDLEAKLNTAQQEIEKLRVSEGSLGTMTSQMQTMEKTIKGLRDDLNQATSRLQAAVMESEQQKDKLNKKNSEMETLRNQMRNNITSHERSLQRLERTMLQQDKSLQEKSQECEQLQKRLHEREQEERLASLKVKASSAHVEDLKTDLDRLRGDCEALKKEREMMIIAHQNQIQDLRNSFKNKMAEIDGWPDKLDRAIRKEREKHSEELQALEQKFKDNFKMELAIEKQKFEKLYAKNLSELKDNESKMRAELSAAHVRYQTEMNELQRTMAESKSRSTETENSLRQEVTGLKSLIADLETRLSRMDSGDPAMVVTLQGKLREAEREMDDLRHAHNKLQDTYNSTAEEIIFLQETVRKECEERFELTEALSLAKEELLTLKKPIGGYNLMKRSSTTRKDGEGTPRSSRNMPDDMYEKTGSPRVTPHPPPLSREGGKKEAVSSINFEMDRELKLPARGIKGALMSSKPNALGKS